MNYQETLEYLYARLPMFQRVGKTAFKKDLTNTLRFLENLGNPHTKFRSVHIAGTNGKGTSAHSLAAILQESGYKCGLYTSPHLKNFTERIRIDGFEVSQQYVIDFVEKHKDLIETIQPSFFETTVVMAFDYFAREKVDVAVVEVGMGGRLDSTNVIDPIVSLITMIGMDHQEFLGETLPEIAGEKAGIIKPGKPVVIGADQPELREVFNSKAKQGTSPIEFATDQWEVHENQDNSYEAIKNGIRCYSISTDLKGKYYKKNLPGILATVDALNQAGFDIGKNAIECALARVCKLTGLKGRWQVLQASPLTICDVGHNPDGMRDNMAQLGNYAYKKLYFVLGGVADKRWDLIFPLLPKQAYYIVTQPTIPRAIQAAVLAEMLRKEGFTCEIEPDVNKAIALAQAKADADDLIFVGGSTFVVAEINNL